MLLVVVAGVVVRVVVVVVVSFVAVLFEPPSLVGECCHTIHNAVCSGNSAPDTENRSTRAAQSAQRHYFPQHHGTVYSQGLPSLD